MEVQTKTGGDLNGAIAKEMQKFKEYCEREFGKDFEKVDEVKKQLKEGKITSARILVLKMGVKNPNSRRKAYKELRRILDMAGVNPSDFEVRHRKIREHVILLPKSLEKTMIVKLEEHRKIKRTVLIPKEDGSFEKKIMTSYRW